MYVCGGKRLRLRFYVFGVVRAGGLSSTRKASILRIAGLLLALSTPLPVGTSLQGSCRPVKAIRKER